MTTAVNPTSNLLKVSLITLYMLSFLKNALSISLLMNRSHKFKIIVVYLITLPVTDYTASNVWIIMNELERT